MARLTHRTSIALLLIPLAFMVCFTEPALAGDYTLTVYGGKITEDRWFESLTTRPEFVDARILVGALAWTFAGYRDGGITLELEGQIGRYFGDQDHFEINVPVAVRLNRFPWDDVLDTSIAFGLGPSFATEVPEAELQYHRSTRRFLAYWFLELAVGPSGERWAGVFRLHHRSGAFGLVAGDGGSNTLCLGLKFTF